ncbi:MAG: response regulator [Lachnospiraceae bacterium]|nr:response regulator [Lachnospiraceae bacterium]
MGIRNIAIVDDDEDLRLILEQYLISESGYNTVLYGSGSELFEGLKTKSIDLILLDIEMPGITGIQVFDRLKSSAYNNIPVIFLTGNEDKNTVLKCIGKGADGYMVKPVIRDALISQIKEVFAKYDEFRSNSTILIVDDDVEFMRIAKIKLSKYHRVLTVNSGKTALDYLSNHHVDLIILDYFMPLYDGNNILNILKYREGTRKIPVVMVSALKEDEVMQACAKNPPDAVVSKPVDTDELLYTIQKMLDRF